MRNFLATHVVIAISVFAILTTILCLGVFLVEDGINALLTEPVFDRPYQATKAALMHNDAADSIDHTDTAEGSAYGVAASTMNAMPAQGLDKTELALPTPLLRKGPELHMITNEGFQRFFDGFASKLGPEWTVIGEPPTRRQGTLHQIEADSYLVIADDTLQDYEFSLDLVTQRINRPCEGAVQLNFGNLHALEVLISEGAVTLDLKGTFSENAFARTKDILMPSALEGCEMLTVQVSGPELTVSYANEIVLDNITLDAPYAPIAFTWWGDIAITSASLQPVR